MSAAKEPKQRFRNLSENPDHERESTQRIRRLLKKPEVAEVLGVTLRGIDQLVASGKLRKRKISRRVVRFSQDDIEQLIDASAESGIE